MQRIAPRTTVAKHTEAIITLNNLIIDMKLKLQGQDADEIVTIARVQELEQVVREIEECRERAIYY
jgi:hypothetical protein